MTQDLPHIERHAYRAVLDALDTSRVVMLHGARQSGKTTLAKQIATDRHGSYASLDDDTVLAAAIDDPVSFLTAGASPRAVDEVQRGGDRLIRAVKRIVDDDSSAGQFLLTGSTNFLTVPTISESLAGRVRLLQLRPLSRAELADNPPASIDAWRDRTPELALGGTTSRLGYLNMVCQGGYPGAVRLGPLHGALAAWFEDYAATVIGRDIGFLASIRDETAMDRMLAWTAACTASTLNVAEAARRLGVTRPSLNRYLEWLRAVFLVEALPAWSRNALGRAVRRPKIHLTDSGLATALLGTSTEALADPTSTAVGPLLETSWPRRSPARSRRSRIGRRSSTFATVTGVKSTSCLSGATGRSWRSRSKPHSRRRPALPGICHGCETGWTLLLLSHSERACCCTPERRTSRLPTACTWPPSTHCGRDRQQSRLSAKLLRCGGLVLDRPGVRLLCDAQAAQAVSAPVSQISPSGSGSSLAQNASSSESSPASPQCRHASVYATSASPVMMPVGVDP